MKILLIYPTQLDKNGEPIKYRKGFLPPLSLAILDSVTPKHHQVSIINDSVETADLNGDYDLVGITVMSAQASRAYQLADRFRKRGIQVVLGGMHPTFMPHEAKQHADAIVIGEAEDSWPLLLADWENGELKPVYEMNSRPDQRTLRLPKWDDMNMSIYPRRIGAKLPMMPIYTTRGCPYKCTFCSVTKFFGSDYRTKPVENVLKEIDATGSKEYFFVDDNIACSPDYSRELFKALPKRNINWFSQISTTVLKNPDLIELAARGGCSYLFVGMESIKQSNLDAVHKKFSRTDQYEELIARMHKAGIIPFISIVFGFDDDTVEQFEATLNFLEKNKVIYTSMWLLTPLPGTDLYQELLGADRIVEKEWGNYDLTKLVFEPKHMSRKEMIDLYWETYQKQYTLLNTLKGIGRSVRVAKKPVHQLFESIFYKFLFRQKINAREHPFSGGFLRVSGKN